MSDKPIPPASVALLPEMAGDWMCHISFYLENLLLYRHDGIYRDRETALAAIGDGLSKVAWGSILTAHGHRLTGTDNGHYLDNIRVMINVNPRRTL